MKRPLLLLLLAGFLLYTAASAVTLVQPGQRAVVRRFGRVLPDKPGPGLYLGLPWGIDLVEAVHLGQPRQVTVGFNPRAAAEDEDLTPRGQLLTGDHNLIDVQADVFYNITEDEVEQYVLNKDRVDTVLSWVTESLLAEFVAGQPVERLMLNGQHQLRARLLEELPRRLGPYRLGIHIHAVSLKPLSPPKEVREEFEKVNQAETAIRTRTYQAEQEADSLQRQKLSEKNQLLQRAASYAGEKLLEAEADAGRFLTKWNQYRLILQTNPDYLQTLWLEEMTRLYARMSADGRLDLFEHLLEKGSLSLFTSPRPPKR